MGFILIMLIVFVGIPVASLFFASDSRFSHIESVGLGEDTSVR